MTVKTRDLLRVTAVYLAALAVAAVLGQLDAFTGPLGGLAEDLGLAPSLVVAFALDVVATLVVFAGSVAFRNASVYDAYWSVAPIAIAAYWFVPPLAAGQANPWRVALVAGLVGWWGVRLTYNWARGWTGLDHEDWRYVDLRQKTGAFWPFTNLLGIHLFPTVQVFLGLLPVHAVANSTAPLGPWDALALVVTAAAIATEQAADRQLHDFRRERATTGKTVLDTGLWAWSRHPNYLGEMGFWWGLWLFAVAGGGEWWRVLGAVAITVMFVFVSVPMIEKRHRERRPDYETKAARGVLFPRRPVKAAQRSGTERSGTEA